MTEGGLCLATLAVVLLKGGTAVEADAVVMHLHSRIPPGTPSECDEMIDRALAVVRATSTL